MVRTPPQNQGVDDRASGEPGLAGSQQITEDRLTHNLEDKALVAQSPPDIIGLSIPAAALIGLVAGCVVTFSVLHLHVDDLCALRHDQPIVIGKCTLDNL